MRYEYAVEKRNYEDFAAGRVLLHRPGATAFPVRLASEVFQRGLAILRAEGKPGPYRVFDPCCGTGYLLAVIGLLHGEHVKAVYASDVDAEMVEFARQNLALLTPAGRAGRIRQLGEFVARFGKQAHREAQASARKISEQQEANTTPALTFAADATRRTLAARHIDLLVADVPYGQITRWQQGSIYALLDAQQHTLDPPAVVAVASDKKQKAAHPAYRRVERLVVGKRHVTILLYPKG